MVSRSTGTMLDEQPLPEPTRRERRSRRARRARAKADRERARAEARVGSNDAVRGQRAPRPEATLSRRERRRRATRRRRWLVLVPTLVAIVAIAFVGNAVRTSRTHHAAPARGGASSGVGTTAAASVPSTLLLVHRDASGRADVFAVADAARDKKGHVKSGSILLLAPDTQAEVPSLDLQSLADVPNLADAALLTTAVENLLAVRVDRTLVLDDAGLVAALTPAAPVAVHLGQDVKAPDGRVVVSRGNRSLSAADAAHLLTSPEKGSELDHLPTVQAVLEGWLERLRVSTVARATFTRQPDLAVFTAIAPATVHTDTIGVDALSSALGERYVPRRAEIAAAMKQLFPQTLLATGARPRIEILNGVGAPELAPRIAAVVVPAGGHVTQTGNVPGFGVTTTQVVYYRDRERKAAQQMLAALRCGSLRRAQEPIDLVDVTILVGADCVSSHS